MSEDAPPYAGYSSANTAPPPPANLGTRTLIAAWINATRLPDEADVAPDDAAVVWIAGALPRMMRGMRLLAREGWGRGTLYVENRHYKNFAVTTTFVGKEDRDGA